MGLFDRKNKEEQNLVVPEGRIIEVGRLEDVDQLVLDYVKAPSTDYAIMLTGTWGAGKTYYWKNALKQSIEEIVSPVIINDQNVKYTAVHVSLFGVEDLNSLVIRITRAKYMGTDSKLKNAVSTLLASGVKRYAKKFDIGAEDFETLLSVVKDVDQKRFVFCFDDLERLSKKVLLEVLGYINTMVENEGVKVVILCNEKELLDRIGESEDKGADYRPFKEKLIRFTYQMSADIERVLAAIIKERESELVEYIESKKSYIVDFYRKGKCNNIRTLKFNIDVYEKLYKLISDFPLDTYKGVVLDHYLMLSMLYSIEYKNGASDENLQELLDLTNEHSLSIDFDMRSFNSLAGIEKQEEDRGPSYIEQVRDRFFSYSPAKIGSSAAFLEYMKTGRFDEAQLKADIANTLALLKDKEMSEEQKLMTTLGSIWTIEDKELRDTIAIILRKVRAGNFALDLMPAAFSRIKAYIDNGFVQGPSLEALKLTFKKGIEKAKSHTTYMDKFESSYSIMTMRVDDDTREIADDVLDIYRSLGKEECIKSFKESVERLWIDQIDMHEYTNSQYDLLNSLDPDEVFGKFAAAKNVVRQWFVTFIQSRFEYAHKAVPMEDGFYRQFKVLCDDYVQKHERASMFKKYCSYVSEHLEKNGIKTVDTEGSEDKMM